MAADALKLAAQRADVNLVVETQGSSGSTPLSADAIAAADAVIFATDIGVRDRGGSRANRSSRPASNARSTNPTP